MDNGKEELEKIKEKYQARNKYINDYMKNNYDRVVLLLPKGYKDIINHASKESGYKSATEYIKALIDRDRNTGGGSDLAENFSFSEEPDNLPFS